jgi:hypothetical protein
MQNAKPDAESATKPQFMELLELADHKSLAARFEIAKSQNVEWQVEKVARAPCIHRGGAAKLRATPTPGRSSAAVVGSKKKQKRIARQKTNSFYLK